jgi:SH3 domain-containing YSC84-like protein 1
MDQIDLRYILRYTAWSAPSAMSPNNLSTGLMLGVDIYDAVLVIRSQAALQSFFSHKATLGSDIGVVAGPFGVGAAMEAGKEKAPVFSYIRSRGMFAGVQLVGQVFVDRYGGWIEAWVHRRMGER